MPRASSRASGPAGPKRSARCARESAASHRAWQSRTAPAHQGARRPQGATWSRDTSRDGRGMRQGSSASPARSPAAALWRDARRRVRRSARAPRRWAPRRWRSALRGAAGDHALDAPAVQAAQARAPRTRRCRAVRISTAAPIPSSAVDDALPRVGHAGRVGRDEAQRRAAGQRLPEPQAGADAVGLGGRPTSRRSAARARSPAPARAGRPRAPPGRRRRRRARSGEGGHRRP